MRCGTYLEVRLCPACSCIGYLWEQPCPSSLLASAKPKEIRDHDHALSVERLPTSPLELDFVLRSLGLQTQHTLYPKKSNISLCSKSLGPMCLDWNSSLGNILLAAELAVLATQRLPLSPRMTPRAVIGEVFADRSTPHTRNMLLPLVLFPVRVQAPPPRAAGRVLGARRPLPASTGTSTGASKGASTATGLRAAALLFWLPFSFAAAGPR